MARRTHQTPKTPGTPRSQKELVFVVLPEVGLRTTPTALYSTTNADSTIRQLDKTLRNYNAHIRPLFGLSEERFLSRRDGSHEVDPNLAREMLQYFIVDAPDEKLDELADQLRALPGVSGCYVKPGGELPAIDVEHKYILNDMQPTQNISVQTIDFRARQVYLNAEPEGIDAGFAWKLPGGRGSGVRVIDCEWGWNFSHEDLLHNQSGIVVGSGIPDDDHGTAVVGAISGDSNGFGITGISPEAIIGAASFHNKPSAQTIREAADKLRPGDILLLEIHRAGPKADGRGQFGYIAIEWWPDDFAAIRYAVQKGIIVVEAAGNGHQNLDDPIYDERLIGFPASWANPFNPRNQSSGAVMVGAGNPPSGIHGRTSHPTWGEKYVDRARCVYSNYGARVDCQGWGWEVTTTGYGDLQSGDRNIWYTDQFSGTSSASPIVVGSLACLQGIVKANSGRPLTSFDAIDLLRRTGSPQQSASGRPASQRIGARPSLRQLVARLDSQGLYREGKMNTEPQTDISTSLTSLLEQRHARQGCVEYEGHVLDDHNIPGNILIVHPMGSVYSFRKMDVIDSHGTSGGDSRVWVRRGAQGFYTSGCVAGGGAPFVVGMEDIAPPTPFVDPDAPSPVSVQSPDFTTFAATLSGAKSAYSGRCVGGDSYTNNCAHFLSDAFIRTGFSELAANNPHINARCNPARRPIRARDMWSWFQSKASRTSRVVQRNTGMWAIFQLKESQYWGGHVVVLDSNAWEYAGTGWYADWDQYLYQW